MMNASTEVSRLQFLQEMRGILTPPSAWTQGTTARKADGNLSLPTDIDATCFCLYGAADLAQYRLVGHEATHAGTFIHDVLENVWKIGFLHFAEFNDDPDTTHPVILEFIDDMIAEELKCQNTN